MGEFVMLKCLKKGKLILVCVLVFCCCLIMSACQYTYVTASVTNGYDIDRIIYTDNVSKYTSGKTLLSTKEMVNDSTDNGGIDNGTGCYYVDNGDGSVDIIFDTTKDFGGSDVSLQAYSWGIYASMCLYPHALLLMGTDVEGDSICVDVINSHKYWFSNKLEVIRTNFNYIHSNPDCTCGENTCDGDGIGAIFCGCNRPGVYPEYGRGGYYEEGDDIYVQYYSYHDHTYGGWTRDTFSFNSNTVKNHCCYEVEELHNTTQEITKFVQVYSLKKYYKNESGTIVLGTTQEEYRKADGTVIGYGEEVIENDTTGIDFNHQEYTQVYSDPDSPSCNGYIEKTFTALGNIDTLYKVTFKDCHLSVEYDEPSIYAYILEGLDGGCVEFDFNELILDGFDFTQSDNYIDALIDVAKAEDIWEQYDYESLLDLNNYSHMFDGLQCKKISLNNVKGMKYQIKDLSYMFANCPNLTTVDFGNFFETVKPTDVSYMFYNCPNLQSVDLSSLDTSTVTNMQHMFDTNPNYDSIVKSTINSITFREWMKNFPTYGLEDLPETNNGAEWTIDSIVEFMEEKSGKTFTDKDIACAKVVVKMYGNFSRVVEGRRAYPFTYDDLVIGLSEGEYSTLEEALEIANADLEEGSKKTMDEFKVELLREANMLSCPIATANNLELLCSYLQGYKYFLDDIEELDFLLKYSETFKYGLEELNIPLTNDGKPWTIDTLTDYANTNGMNVTKNEVVAYVKYLGVMCGYDLKFDYDEIAIVLGGFRSDIQNLSELLAANLSMFESTTLEDLKKEIKAYLFEEYTDNSSSTNHWFKVYSQKELELRENHYGIGEYKDQEEVDRTDYINSLLNTEYLSELQKIGYPETNNGSPWTWDSVAIYMIEELAKDDAETQQAYLENPDQVIRYIKVLLVAELMLNHPEIPIRYDEILIADSDGEFATIEEYVDYLNTNNPKESGELYTKQEIIAELDTAIGSLFENTIVDASETDTLKILSGGKLVKKKPNTTLTLGGEGSKFCVTSDIKIDNMLSNSKFTKIVTPTIEKGVSIELSQNYYSGTSVSKTLTAGDSNKTFTIWDLSDPDVPSLPDTPIVPDTPSTPDEPASTPASKKESVNLKMILLVCVPVGAIIIIGFAVVLVSQMRNKKSNSPNMDRVFEKANREGKRIMLILDTWKTLRNPETFNRYVHAIKAYYGDGFVYYYKGVPQSPVNQMADKASYLESLGLIDVDYKLATERLLMLNPNIYCSGYSSTAFEIVDTSHCGALLNVRRSLFGENYKYKVEFFVTAVSSSDIRYGRIATGNDCCVLEFTNNERYDVAIYSESQNTLRFYKLNGTNFIETSR